VKILNIRDIARMSNVSVSTVSRVINHHSDVHPETRARIQGIIEEQGYIPNANARHLKLIKEKQVGILVKGIFNPFFSGIVEIMEKELTRRGYTTILHYSAETRRDIDILLEKTLEQNLGGLVYLGGDFDAASLEALEALDIPVVLTSSDFPWEATSDAFSSVTIDNVKVAFTAVTTLCERGLTRIAMLAPGPGGGKTGERRLQGYREALADFHLPFNPSFVHYGDYTMASGYGAMKDMLETHPEVQGVFAASDQIALGAAKYILTTGRTIPGDLSIIGIDGIEYTRYFHPSLSTMVQPMAEFARQTLLLLISQIEGRDPGRRHLRLEATLFQGESIIGGTP